MSVDDDLVRSIMESFQVIADLERDAKEWEPRYKVLRDVFRSPVLVAASGGFSVFAAYIAKLRRKDFKQMEKDARKAENLIDEAVSRLFNMQDPTSLLASAKVILDDYR